MNKKRATKDMLASLSIDDARSVGRFLYDEYLTQKWLQMRLYADWGVKIHISALSELIGGKRELGPKMRLAVWCSLQIIKEYKEFYNTQRWGGI